MDRNDFPIVPVELTTLSLSARRAWIEICLRLMFWLFRPSLSARRAWIEILQKDCHHQAESVALRKESVDRNTRKANRSRTMQVALRKESVDRNGLGFCHFCDDFAVALRKESVDRNIWVNKTQSPPSMSLSARRAWIEISSNPQQWHLAQVALRKESVDRNKAQVRKFLYQS